MSVRIESLFGFTGKLAVYVLTIDRKSVRKQTIAQKPPLEPTFRPNYAVVPPDRTSNFKATTHFLTVAAICQISSP